MFSRLAVWKSNSPSLPGWGMEFCSNCPLSPRDSARCRSAPAQLWLVCVVASAELSIAPATFCARAGELPLQDYHHLSGKCRSINKNTRNGVTACGRKIKRERPSGVAAVERESAIGIAWDSSCGFLAACGEESAAVNPRARVLLFILRAAFLSPYLSVCLASLSLTPSLSLALLSLSRALSRSLRNTASRRCELLCLVRVGGSRWL